jgi:hypothetical protein
MHETNQKGKLLIHYKDHLIEYFSDRLPSSDKWRGKARISWVENGISNLTLFDGPIIGFSSLLEAESWGLEFGKRWIDEGKPVIP